MTSAATTQLQLDGISVIVSESFSLFHHCLPAPPCIYHCTSNLRLCHFFRKLCNVFLPLRMKPKFLPWQKDSTLPSISLWLPCWSHFLKLCPSLTLSQSHWLARPYYSSFHTSGLLLPQDFVWAVLCYWIALPWIYAGDLCSYGTFSMKAILTTIF